MKRSRDTLAALHELGIEQALGRIVHDDDEGRPGVRGQGQPAMATAVEMQQFAEARPRLAPPPMAAARPAPAHEAGLLQGLPDEAVRQPHVMLAPDDVAEAPHIEAGVAVARAIALAIEPEHALHLVHGHRAWRARPPQMEQPGAAAVLIAQAYPLHRPRTHAQDVGHLKPTLPSAQ